MDKAKAAVSDFMHRSGKHDTTVHESVAPGVQHEAIKPHQHENVTTAVDKEVHQDHYHRTVQPVHDREVLPEKHHANLGAVEHREFDHRDHEGIKHALGAEQSGFKDERVVHDATQSQSAQPTIGGEHVHHHIHETIQPVVKKETVEPHVVHTTVPIHETHHNAAQHHSASTMPAMSMSDFKNKGGVLGGREERYDAFDGEPKHIGGTMSHMMEGKTSKRDSAHTDNQVRKSAMHGDHDPLDGGVRHGGSGLTSGERNGNVRGYEEGSVDGTHDTARHHDSGLDKSSSGKPKVSFMDKLNPRVDADGDGKKGMMD